MKRLSTLALLLGATALCAQSLHWNSQPQFTNEPAKLAPAPDGRWLVGSTQFYPTKSTGVVTALLPNGQEAWNVHLDVSPETAVTDLLALPDGKVLVSGEATDCDAIYPGFLLLLDSDGSEIWRQQYGPGGNAPYYIRSLAPGPNSHFFVGSAGVVYECETATGLTVASYPLTGFLQALDLYYEPTSDLLVIGGNQGVTFRTLMQNTEVTVKPVTLNAKVIKVLPWKNGAVLGLTNTGIIEVFTADGSTVQSLDVAIQDMQPFGAGLILCGRNGSASVIRFVDENFASLGEVELPNPDLFALAARPIPGGYVLAGVEMNGTAPRLPNTRYSPFFNGTNNQHLWVQQFDDDVVPVPTTDDAALTELIVNTPPTAKLADPNSEWPYQVTGGTFSVKLVNTGGVPLQSVTLNASGYGHTNAPFTCSPPNIVFRELQNLNLAPGEEKIIDLGEIGSEYVASITPWELCVWTSRPNGQADNFHENDYTCRSFDLTTSNKEKYAAQIDLRPNPATDAVYFTSSQANPGLCRVYNTAGGLVLEQMPLLENGQYRLSVKKLPAGLYFLQSELGWGRFVRM